MTDQDQLKNQKYRNWIKAVLSLKNLKVGIEEFADNGVKLEHRRILTKIGVTSASTCQKCLLWNLKPLHKSIKHSNTSNNICPKGQRNCNCLSRNKKKCKANICDKIYEEILESHASSPPSPCWKNTDINKWTTHPWEVAKCFINAPGYADTENAKDIDVAGLLHLFINNINLQDHLSLPHKDLPEKIVQMRNKTIHAPYLEMEDQQLNTCISDIIDLLEDDKELKEFESAKEAAVNLRKLRNEGLFISSQQETEVCRLAMLSITQEKDELRELIKDTKADQESKQNMKQNLITLENTVSHLEKRIQELERTNQVKTKDITADLREDIVTYYREKESDLPVSPVMKSYDVDLISHYVQPTLKALKAPESCRNTNQISQTLPIEPYMLFNMPVKNIYLTANSGMGKTSFSQYLTMTWCQAHLPLPETSKSEHFKEEDLNAMKQYDLCFLLHLHDYRSCDVDDMIAEFLSKYISRKYSLDELATVLHERRCLIILDGLDQWSHPVTCQRRDGNIPHRKVRQRCTVVTTTPTWRLSTVPLNSGEIDWYVEISGLVSNYSKTLEYSIKILNNRPGVEQKEVADFKNNISDVIGSDICSNPYIMLGLICKWFDGKLICNTKCEIYSNIIELSLERGPKSKNILHLQTSEPYLNYTLPKCMANCWLCRNNIHLLNKLGALAFFLLCQLERSALNVNRLTALKYLKENELDFLLKIGLLSQIKDTRTVSELHIEVFFQNKSIQEFLAALYISTEWNKNRREAYTRIIKVFKSLEDILEMKQVFVFLSGMNPISYSEIAGRLQAVIEHDKGIVAYRTKLDWTSYDLLRSYQSMHLACLKENQNSGHVAFSVPVRDLIVSMFLSENELNALTKLVKSTEGQVKSVYIDGQNTETKRFLENTGSTVYQSLESLYLWKSFEPDIMDSVFKKSARTLKCLSIEFAMECRSIEGLKYLDCLQALHLFSVSLGHDDLEELYVILNTKRNLKSLNLKDVLCFCDCERCKNTKLDLSNTDKIEQLQLWGTQMKELHLNMKACSKCTLNFEQPATPINIQQVFASITNAKMLAELTLSGVAFSDICNSVILDLSQLETLQTLRLTSIPKVSAESIEPSTIGHFVLLLSPQMLSLRCMDLRRIIITSEAWKRVFLEVRKLKQLEKLILTDINLGDSPILLSPNMTSFRSFELKRVTMTSRVLEQLNISIKKLRTLKNFKLKHCVLSESSE